MFNPVDHPDVSDSRRRKVTSKEMFTALERNARRLFLSTKDINEVVNAHIGSDDPVYHEVRKLFKTGKNRTLDCAVGWFRDGLHLPDNRNLQRGQSTFILQDGKAFSPSLKSSG